MSPTLLTIYLLSQVPQHLPTFETRDGGQEDGRSCSEEPRSPVTPVDDAPPCYLEEVNVLPLVISPSSNQNSADVKTFRVQPICSHQTGAIIGSRDLMGSDQRMSIYTECRFCRKPALRGRSWLVLLTQKSTCPCLALLQDIDPAQASSQCGWYLLLLSPGNPRYWRCGISMASRQLAFF